MRRLTANAMMKTSEGRRMRNSGVAWGQCMCLAFNLNEKYEKFFWGQFWTHQWLGAFRDVRFPYGVLNAQHV